MYIIYFRLKDGLDALGVLDAIKQNKCLYNEFRNDLKPVVVKDIEEIFTPSFSPVTTKEYLIEQEAVSQFFDYLEEKQSMYLKKI